ncbi:alpha/beta hydrolase [Microbulbifer hydrolyticus]|uniref:Alpha/beta hydrolase n=1 Tax=Microbulbifer hydrolyticus TaxID=48074 RepID=A0A6P1TDG4_9GAMM|nr:alpha/beta hydrolase [Microbulbifer hydrolyticus]MBB5210144.1 dienelactone hydrolase [Microbulbifer hydrolyticus]QHQ39339.1 alpha/beta hydrolase [Microbulbifer hydrolyticus]
MMLTRLVKIAGFFAAVFMFHTSAHADAQAEVDAAMTSSPAVKVFQKRDWVGVSQFFGFEPAQPVSSRGLIIYPGAFVDPRAYAPLARHFADLGYHAAVVTPPFNLGLLGSNYADYVKYYWKREVSGWVIGGHSLGGVVAADYVNVHRASWDKVDALFLLAAYPNDLAYLNSLDIPVTSIWGAVDGLTTEQDIEDSKARLPAHTKYVRIEGGNHTQFYYSDTLQSDDNPALISREAQQAIVEQEIGLLLN